MSVACLSEYICLSVCVCLSAIKSELQVRFSQKILCVAYGCCSVLLWRRGDKLRISGFMDDVMFAHKLRLLDVAARLRQRGSHVRSLGLGA